MAKFLLKVISIKFNSLGPPVHSHFFCFKHTNKFRIEMRQCNKSLWVMQKTKFCKNFIFQENKIDIFSRSRKSTLFQKKWISVIFQIWRQNGSLKTRLNPGKGRSLPVWQTRFATRVTSSSVEDRNQDPIS